jgi:predicted nucleotidyltransferase
MAAIKASQIQKLSREIADAFHPDRIILFGSYADGNPSVNSDVDLLIVMPYQGKQIDKAVEVRLKIKPPFPVDILVRTPEKIAERLSLGDSFIQEILEKGKVLYEASHP